MILEALYREMSRMRRVEEALGDLWAAGYATGEMHLGIGEEAIAAGVTAHLGEGDAMALDYRATPPLVGRGVDPEAILAEAAGLEEGLCHGHGGHMHLFSPDHLAASTGIVGSPAPLGVGFALSGQNRRPASVAVAFFGDGAVNQGMVMESLNLAVVWKLPVIFVCKDNGWAVTTRSSKLTGGTPARRARAFGMPADVVDGRDVRKVWKAVGRAVDRARGGGGPTFIVARCHRPRGHFEDDPLVRLVRHPSELWEMLPDMLAGVSGGGGLRSTLNALGRFTKTLFRVAYEQWVVRWDPLPRTARLLPGETVASIDAETASEVDEAVQRVLSQVSS